MRYHQGWDIEAVRKICCYFYSTAVEDKEGISAFTKLLPPAAVCRIWRNSMLPYVYKTAYLGHKPKRDSEHMWVSNIDLIVSLNLSTQVRELDIAFNGEDGVCCIPTILDSFGFSSTYWFKVSKLSICDSYAFDAKAQLAPSDNEHARSAQLKDYFAYRIPNIRYLNLRLDDTPDVNRMFANRMISLYSNQLYTLDSGVNIPITFNTSRFGESLTRLTLAIDPDTANRLPQILASQVQYLQLYDVPEHFSWNVFYSYSPTVVTFASLEVLWLSFKSETVSENLRKTTRSEAQITRIINQDANIRKLCFPRLQKLSLFQNPYSDATFYKCFEQSPVQELRIFGSFKSMKNINAGMLLNLSCLRLCVYSRDPSEPGVFSFRNGFKQSEEEELSLFTKRLFGSASHAEEACFSIYKYAPPLPIPDITGWRNLMRLSLINSVYLSSAINLVTQCPRLEKLFVGKIVNDIKDIDVMLYEIVNHGPTHAKCVSGMLERLRIFDPMPVEPTTDLNSIIYLALTIRSLRKVYIPSIFIADIENFMVGYSHSFSHLNEIEVCEDPSAKESEDRKYAEALFDPFNF